MRKIKNVTTCNYKTTKKSEWKQGLLLDEDKVITLDGEILHEVYNWEYVEVGAEEFVKLAGFFTVVMASSIKVEKQKGVYK
jgi:hypothetical protein